MNEPFIQTNSVLNFYYEWFLWNLGKTNLWPLYERLYNEAYKVAPDTTNNIMFFENDKNQWMWLGPVPGAKAGSAHHALDFHSYCYWEPTLKEQKACHVDFITSMKWRAD